MRSEDLKYPEGYTTPFLGGHKIRSSDIPELPNVAQRYQSVPALGLPEIETIRRIVAIHDSHKAEHIDAALALKGRKQRNAWLDANHTLCEIPGEALTHRLSDVAIAALHISPTWSRSEGTNEVISQTPLTYVAYKAYLSSARNGHHGLPWNQFRKFCNGLRTFKILDRHGEESFTWYFDSPVGRAYQGWARHHKEKFLDSGMALIIEDAKKKEPAAIIGLDISGQPGRRPTLRIKQVHLWHAKGNRAFFRLGNNPFQELAHRIAEHFASHGFRIELIKGATLAKGYISMFIEEARVYEEHRDEIQIKIKHYRENILPYLKRTYAQPIAGFVRRRARDSRYYELKAA